MAYLDFAERSGAAALHFPIAPAPVVRETLSGFTQREWLVVRLAREDRLSSIREESDFVQFVRLLFGFERKKPLSDPKLEALRRIAVLSWHHSYNVNNADITEFLSEGYSVDQYDAMLAHMGRERAASTQRNRFQGTRP